MYIFLNIVFVRFSLSSLIVPLSAGMNLEILISLPKSVEIVHVLWIQVYLGEYLKYTKYIITEKQNKYNFTPN